MFTMTEAALSGVLRRLAERGFQKEKIVLIGDREFGGRQTEAAVKRLGIRYSAGSYSLAYASGFAE